jgi:hypothetical protein
LIILADAKHELMNMRKEGLREIHTLAPRKADPPARHNCMNWLGKSLRPLAAAARTGESDSRVEFDSTLRVPTAPN